MTVSTSWVTPQYILAERRNTVLEAIDQRIPAVVQSIVLSYLPQPRWYSILENINALPHSVPPFTRKMEQILDTECPIYGAPHKIADTFNLYLFPVGQVTNGRINTLIELMQYCKLDQINIPSPLLASKISHPNINQLKGPRWFLISKQWLPNSENKTREEQMATIQRLCKTSRLHFAAPLIRDALAATSLEISATGQGLWLTPASSIDRESMVTTRVQECIVTKQAPAKRSIQFLNDITVGTLVERIPHVKTIIHNSAHPRVGMAVVLHFSDETEDPSPNASCCAVS